MEPTQAVEDSGGDTEADTSGSDCDPKSKSPLMKSLVVPKNQVKTTDTSKRARDSDGDTEKDTDSDSEAKQKKKKTKIDTPKEDELPTLPY